MVFLQVIGKLIHLIKAFFQNPSPPPDTSRISQIPPEILLLVADQLPVESRLILSRTCRRARYILRLNWESELRQLPPDRRLRCVLLIAYDLPDYLACGMCYSLHRVRVDSTPSCYETFHYRCYEPQDRQYVHSWPGSVRYGRYILVHNHVQLALKYTRLAIRVPYLEALVKPSLLHNTPEMRGLHRDHSLRTRIPERYGLWIAEKPKIVDGRFLHESVWDVRCKFGGPIHWKDVCLTWPHGCSPHFYLLRGLGILHLREQNLCRGNGEIDGCYSFPARKTSVQSFSCEICRTDLQFRFEYSRWVIRCWRDFGTEMEPFLPTDTLCMQKGSSNLRLRPPARPTAPYKQGPIEAMYNERMGRADEVRYTFY